MKLMVICYNVAIHQEVMDVLKETGIKNYTRFERAQGVGDLAGPHLGTNIWPAVNSVLAVAVEDDKKDRLIERIKELRKKLGKEGIKAFVLPLEEIT
jgi:nitrogen regulatory protein PII